MLYTEESARDNVRNRDGKRVFYLGANDRLTASARDWLNREGIDILPAEKARPERYCLAGGGYDNESAALSVQVIDKVYQELVDFTKS